MTLILFYYPTTSILFVLILKAEDTSEIIFFFISAFEPPSHTIPIPIIWGYSYPTTSGFSAEPLPVVTISFLYPAAEL